MRARTLLAVAALLVAASGCAAPAVETPDVTRLEGVEVREYEGERLDSLTDFRENSIKGPQDIDRDTYRLTVGGLVDDPAEYTYSEVASGFPAFRKVVQLDCVEGWSATILWEGVLVRDILDESGVQAEARSVVFSAVDGYTTSFPVSYFYDRDILLAYTMNDVTIPPIRGFPFQLIAEDKWGYKWCKWVTGIELVEDADPGGYWEDRGYSNTGDRDESFFN
ncbi:MAG: molybdopterin-dependent oxidoreductase [Coriobacteriia bacterium]|nr:molybdopterin-dependent oxidoreductase [Coriobacteriia bacterium]